MSHDHPVKFQAHAIDFIREAAKIQYHAAFTSLQFAKTEFDLYEAAEEMELWKSVEVLIEQRDKLQKYCRLLINTDAEEQTVNAAKEYLEGIGIEP